MSVITQSCTSSLTVAPSEPFFPKIPPSLPFWKPCPEDGDKIHLFTQTLTKAQHTGHFPALKGQQGMMVENWTSERLLWDPAEHSHQDSSPWEKGLLLSQSLISSEICVETEWKLHWQLCPTLPPPVAFSIFHFIKQESEKNSQIAVYSKGKAGKAGSPPEARAEQSPCKQGCVNSAGRQLFVFPTNGNYVL